MIIILLIIIDAYNWQLKSPTSLHSNLVEVYIQFQFIYDIHVYFPFEHLSIYTPCQFIDRARLVIMYTVMWK